MKNLKSSVLIAGITILACSAWAADTEAESILSLSQDSRKADVECQAFLSQLHGRTRDSEKKEYFVSRASARAALSAAPDYPGAPIATAEALDRLFELSDPMEAAKSGELLSAVNALSDCHSVEFFGVLTRLMDPRTRKHLAASEITELREVVLDYLKRETNNGPRLLHQTKTLVEITARGSHERLLSFPKSAQADLANLQWIVSKLDFEESTHRQALEDASATAFDSKSDRRGLQEFMRQLQQSEDLRADLFSVLERESTIELLGPGIEFGGLADAH